MDILSLSRATVAELSRRLRRGEVIALPTETAYGLVAAANNRRAVARIYQIKGREQVKALPLICSSLSQVRTFFLFPRIRNFSFVALARRHWPGALSIQLLPRRPLAAPDHEGTYAVRVSGLKLLRQVARQLGVPLTATSANLAGTRELYDSEDVVAQFRHRRYQPDAVLLAGAIQSRPPSTIVGQVQGVPMVFRQGEIKVRLPYGH